MLISVRFYATLAMMTTREIYKKYKITPFLQEHMLCVTAVAKQVAMNMTVHVNTHDIITTCLLHDMGNILKFNLDLFPDTYEPEGRGYWVKVQQEYKDKYGGDEHHATTEIARELKQPERIVELLKKMGFSKSVELFEDDDFEAKICAYADNRVGPYGVKTLIERLRDGQKRYEANHHTKSDHEFFEKMLKFAIKAEAQVLAKCKLKGSEITDRSIEKIRTELAEFKFD